MTALSARTPLRIQLVAGVVALSALGLSISGVAASTALRGYLIDRVDAQLVGFATGRVPLRTGGPRGEGRFTTVYIRAIDQSGTPHEEVPAGYSGPRVPTTVPTHPITVHSLQDSEPDWRLIGAVDQVGNPVVLGLSLRDIQSTTHRLVLLEGGVGLIVLLLIGGVGYVVVRRSLRPLVAVETTAQAIAAGDLTQRVPEGDARTEVGSLSQSLNAMLGQIETAFAERSASEAQARASEDRMRQFVADASHELRTPLTSIRGFAELYRSGALGTKEQIDHAMSRVEGEASRMGLLVEDLLLLARLDQQRPLERAPVDLLLLAGDAVQDARAVDPDRRVDLQVVAGGPPPLVHGDGARLRQVFGNLVSNALVHTPAGAPVVVRVSTSPTEATVEVADSGTGIPVDDRERVFERFFRADTSRARASGGNGLGLSIVSALIAAHGGSVTVDDTPGGGATFRVRLPLSAADR